MSIKEPLQESRTLESGQAQQQSLTAMPSLAEQVRQETAMSSLRHALKQLKAHVANKDRSANDVWS